MGRSIKITIPICIQRSLQFIKDSKKTIKTGNKNSPNDIPNQVKLRAFPLVFSKYLETVVEAVCAISPWPDNLKRKIPTNKKIIPLTKEKNILAKKRRDTTKIE